MARVAYVENRRDIQILETTNHIWTFVGTNGGALTGFDWNFLPDAKQGPDGRLWVLATHPTAAARYSYRNYLFCFENGSWRIAGPKDGHPYGDFGDDGLHFLGGAEPVHHFVQLEGVKSGHTEDCLLQLRGDKWVELPAQELLRRTGGRLAWRKQDAWLVSSQWTNGATLVDGYFLAGSKKDDIYGPFRLWSGSASNQLWRVAASDKNELALLLRDRDLGGWTCCIVSADRNGVHRVTEVLPPPVEYVSDLMWSPTGNLAVTSTPGFQSVQVQVLRDGQWRIIAEASQPDGEGLILSDRLHFRDDGMPIVTWEDFFQM